MLPIILTLQAATFQGIGAVFLPLVMVALLLDSAIVTIWYMLGSMLGNAAVKASARSEFYQVAGTALLAVLIMALLTTFSISFYNILGSTKLLNPTATNSICQGIMSNTKLAMLGSDGAIMHRTTSSSSPFPGLCDMVDPAELQTPTTQMDYPLAVTGVIIANLTNQTITNLNSAFVVDSFFGFLSTLQPEMRLCTGDFVTPAEQCILPIPDPATTTEYIGMSFVPYAGFDFIYKSMTDFGTMLTNAYTLFVAQLVFVVIFVFIWPYLIFIGLVLRSNPFTRGVGGLLIAVAIGMVLFYPFIYSTEYLSLNTWSQQQSAPAVLATSVNAIYGYNYVTSIPGSSVVVCPGEGTAPPSSGCACGTDIPYKPVCTGSKPYCTGSVDPTCNYTVNFFVQPSIENIALSNSCWPEIAGHHVALIVAEVADIDTLQLPGYSMFSLVAAQLSSVGAVPRFPLPATCYPDNAVKTFEGMLQSFGIIGITAYLLPVLNLVITLSAILGLSGLLGGDTSLAGIAKLL